MADQTSTLRVPGVIGEVRKACDFVVDFARSAGLSDDAVFQCQLSVEEVFTNIVEHGYAHDGDEKSIEIVNERKGDVLLITLIDEAPPFNPLDLDKPNPDLPLWERNDGGWGVYFVRQYMDDVRYRLVDGRNHLILEKKFDSHTSA